MTVKLNSEQLAFLKKQKIPLSRVFNATGLKPNQYRPLMKELDCDVAYGVSACKAQGHTLRSRSGNCVQCSTANLAFQKRFKANGFIYVGISNEIRAVKIGISNDVKKRFKLLNTLEYAGASDWQCVFWSEVPNAGMVEYEVHELLSPYNISLQYMRNGSPVNCQETFSCSINTAIKGVKSKIEHNGKHWVDENVLNVDPFSDLDKTKANSIGSKKSLSHSQGIAQKEKYSQKTSNTELSRDKSKKTNDKETIETKNEPYQSNHEHSSDHKPIIWIVLGAILVGIMMLMGVF